MIGKFLTYLIRNIMLNITLSSLCLSRSNSSVILMVQFHLNLHDQMPYFGKIGNVFVNIYDNKLSKIVKAKFAYEVESLNFLERVLNFKKIK